MQFKAAFVALAIAIAAQAGPVLSPSIIKPNIGLPSLSLPSSLPTGIGLPSLSLPSSIPTGIGLPSFSLPSSIPTGIGLPVFRVVPSPSINTPSIGSSTSSHADLPPHSNTKAK